MNIIKKHEYDYMFTCTVIHTDYGWFNYSNHPVNALVGVYIGRDSGGWLLQVDCLEISGGRII